MAERAEDGLWPDCRMFHERDETKMLNLGHFELGNVLDVAVTRLWLRKGCVLVNNAIHGPLLKLSSCSHNTASSVLHIG